MSLPIELGLRCHPISINCCSTRLETKTVYTVLGLTRAYTCTGLSYFEITDLDFTDIVPPEAILTDGCVFFAGF